MLLLRWCYTGYRTSKIKIKDSLILIVAMNERSINTEVKLKPRP